MKQERKMGIIEAIVSVDRNLGLFEYEDKVNGLLIGFSSDEKRELNQEIESLMQAWWNTSADKSNPYATAYGYFNPAGGC